MRKLSLRARITVMFVACRPRSPCCTSNSTLSPSLRERKPPELMPEKWAKTSSEPSSGAMKPKPFSALNHFTVPVAMSACFLDEGQSLRRSEHP